MSNRRIDEGPAEAASSIVVEPRPVQCRSTVEHVGGYLRRLRETKGLSLEDVAARTKIQVDSLRFIDEGALDRLPAEVFARGFARAYANSIGGDAAEATRLVAAHYAAQSPPPELPRTAAPEAYADGRRRVGVVLVVLVLLIAATLTLSLLLRRNGPAEGGLSSAPMLSAPVVA